MLPAGMKTVAQKEGQSVCVSVAATTVVPLFAANCKQKRAPLAVAAGLQAWSQMQPISLDANG